MKRKIIIIGGVIYLALIAEFIFYMTSDSDSQGPPTRQETYITRQNPPVKSTPTTTKTKDTISSKTKSRQNYEIPGIQAQSDQAAAESQQARSLSTGVMGSDRHTDSQEAAYDDIEEIKRKIYDMNIEYVDDLEALEQIVQTGEADQADFWDGDWYSADDWKRRHDAFQLKTNEYGSFSFATEDRIHQPSQAFTFDKKKKEFYWEEDYYGKIITHRAKFITPSTLLIIKTSGIKVNLDIYEKGK